MIGLTPKQRECLDYVIDYRSRFGSIPTYRKIAEAIHLESTSGVFRMICELERRGYVRRTGRQACSPEVLDQDKRCHCGHPIGSSLCRAAAARKSTYSSTPATQRVAT